MREANEQECHPVSLNELNVFYTSFDTLDYLQSEVAASLGWQKSNKAKSSDGLKGRTVPPS